MNKLIEDSVKEFKQNKFNLDEKTRELAVKWFKDTFGESYLKDCEKDANNPCIFKIRDTDYKILYSEIWSDFFLMYKNDLIFSQVRSLSQLGEKILEHEKELSEIKEKYCSKSKLYRLKRWFGF